jgi:hypothetical protein
MDALEPFERFAWKPGKYVPESVICPNEMVLRVFQRKSQFGR